MRRDYYRGSHDSLADRGMGSGILYRGDYLFLFYFICSILFLIILFTPIFTRINKNVEGVTNLRVIIL